MDKLVYFIGVPSQDSRELQSWREYAAAVIPEDGCVPHTEELPDVGDCQEGGASCSALRLHCFDLIIKVSVPFPPRAL